MFDLCHLYQGLDGTAKDLQRKGAVETEISWFCNTAMQVLLELSEMALLMPWRSQGLPRDSGGKAVDRNTFHASAPRSSPTPVSKQKQGLSTTCFVDLLPIL